MTSPRLQKGANFWRNPVARKWLKRAFLLAGWSIVLGLLIWTGWKERAVLIPLFAQAHWDRSIWVVLGYCVSLVFALAGWMLVMHTLHPGIDTRDHIRIYALTLVSRRLPGTIWYIGGRVAMYEDHQVSPRVVLLANGLEVILMLDTGSLVGLALLSLSRSQAVTEVLSPIMIGLIAVVCALGAVLMSPRFLKRILRWRRPEFTLPLIRWRDVLKWLLAFGGMWLTGGLMTAAMVSIFQSLKFWDWVYVMGCWPLAGVAGIFTMLLPSSFGATELTLAVLLSRIIPLPLAGAVAILLRLSTILLEILLALTFYLLYSKRSIDPLR